MLRASWQLEEKIIKMSKELIGKPLPKEAKYYASCDLHWVFLYQGLYLYIGWDEKVVDKIVEHVTEEFDAEGELCGGFNYSGGVF